MGFVALNEVLPFLLNFRILISTVFYALQFTEQV